MYNLWLRRNGIVFNNNLVKGDLVLRIMSQATEILSVERNGTLQPTKPNSNTVEYPVGWYPPPLDFLKINVDGAAVGNSSLGSCGGVLKDRNGALLWNFVLNIGRCLVLKDKGFGYFSCS